MKPLPTTALTMLLCAYPAAAKDIRDRRPVIQQTSQRPLTDIEACLAERWVQTIDFPTGTVPMANGIIYNTRSPVTAFAMTIEVRDQTQGRVVTAWVKTAPMSFVKVKDHIAKVRSCL